jgi:hypothetical protein
MSDTGKGHEFLCEGKTWTVARSTTVPSQQAGLCFRRDSETRFLAFTRGALPSDRELRAMSEEVLCTLLQRAVVQ